LLPLPLPLPPLPLPLLLVPCVKPLLGVVLLHAGISAVAASNPHPTNKLKAMDQDDERRMTPSGARPI
jgi:hypothetical protein